MYKPPRIESGRGIVRRLKDVSGTVLAVTMDIPWRLLQESFHWNPACVHMVTDMDRETLDGLLRTLPECDVVVGVGGGSCCDTAKFIAWKRGCRMILVPTIVSVDAPLTNMIAVRVDKAVTYIGDLFPEELVIDYDLIRKAPPELNRAGAGDIASIHTALYDWQLAHERIGEAYAPTVADLARECLEELDRNAVDVRAVTPKGIDTIVDLYRREVAFCAEIGTSRPEEGSEHLVAYNVEHITRRHFVHGDLVALGIFLMSRLQGNRHEWVVDLMDRLGLQYRVPGVAEDEVRQALISLKAFKNAQGLFFSVVDTTSMDEAFIREAVQALFA